MADILGKLMKSQAPINFICHFHIWEYINNVISNKQYNKKWDSVFGNIQQSAATSVSLFHFMLPLVHLHPALCSRFTLSGFHTVWVFAPAFTLQLTNHTAYFHSLLGFVFLPYIRHLHFWGCAWSASALRQFPFRCNVICSRHHLIISFCVTGCFWGY